jgi:hypothetical protein
VLAISREKGKKAANKHPCKTGVSSPYLQG